MPKPPVPANLWMDTLLQEAHGYGFNIESMKRTAGKMIVGADHIAEHIADMSVRDDSDPREIREWAQALKHVTQSLEIYAGVSQWCEQFGQTGKETYNSLQDLIPYLDGNELHTLQGWMGRLPAAA
jgi:hypothetical protein